jgi:hypothetical protein
MKEEPVPIPPIPGISPAHALPLQLGQTRQAPLNFSRAIRCISFQSISSPLPNPSMQNFPSTFSGSLISGEYHRVGHLPENGRGRILMAFDSFANFFVFK